MSTPERLGLCPLGCSPFSDKNSFPVYQTFPPGKEFPGDEQQILGLSQVWPVNPEASQSMLQFRQGKDIFSRKRRVERLR